MSTVNSDLLCAVCKEPFDGIYRITGRDYDNLVCRRCDSKAVTTEGGEEPEHGNDYLNQDSVIEKNGKKVLRMDPDVGDNPVYIDGEKCWRLYKFGGFITLWDPYDCDSMDEFFSRLPEENAVNDH